jgi:arylsulfatase A-like enzyme
MRAREPQLRDLATAVGALIAIAGLAALAGGCRAGDDRVGPGGERPWSVLLLTIDTLRPDYLGANGYDLETSPYLDALLAEGVTFEKALTPIARTTPALAALLTGAYPHRNGVRRLTDTLSGEAVSLAEVLRDRGYQTLAVVSNEVLNPERGLRRGFDVYDFRGNLRNAGGTAEAALGYLDVLDRTRPLFAWVHYLDPHVPYHPDPSLATAFDPDYRGPYRFHFGRQPGPGEPPASYRTFPEDLPKARATHRNPLDERVNAHIRRLYAAEIRSTDDAVRHLVEGFREVLGEHLIVIFTADHGESLGEHDFYFDHGDYVYDASLRVPLGVILPGAHPLSRRGRCEQWVSLVDLAPTLLELLGVEPTHRLGDQIEGRSLVPCLRGEDLPERPVFAESGFAYYFDLVRRRERNGVAGRFRAVTLDGWKLIWTPFQRPEWEWELYHLDEDPGETRNLYRPDHPRLAELKASLEAWMARAGEEPPQRPLSDRDRERLRALGYLGTGGEAGEASPSRDR